MKVLIVSLFLLIGCSKNADLANMPGSRTPTATNPPQELAELSWNFVSHDFGAYTLNHPVTKDLILVNYGKADSKTIELAWMNLTAGFSILVDNCSGKVLKPSMGCTVKVQAKAMTSGLNSNTLIGKDSNSQAKIDLTIIGNQVPGELTFVPNSLNFGQLVTGQSATLIATLKNTGVGDVSNISFNLVSSNFSIVTGQNGCINKTLVQDEECTLVIRFTPSAVMTYDEILEAVSGNLSDELHLTGEGIPDVSNYPLSYDGNFTTPEDTPLNAQVTANDPLNSSLTYILVSSPTHGSLTFNSNGTFLYTPDANYFGSDTFNFKVVNSQNLISNISTAYITVTSENDLPVANLDYVTLDEDTSVSINVLANDTDSDLDPLTISSVGVASHGSVSIVNNKILYIPYANYFGVDSFQYFINDGKGGTSFSTVDVLVNPINDAPLAQDINTTAYTATAKAITLLGSDVDGDSLTYVITQSPSNGSYNIVGSALNYTSSNGFVGTDTIKYKVFDGLINSSEKTVTIVVSEYVAPPIVPTGWSVTHEIKTDWGSGYGYDVWITNNSGVNSSNGWTLCFYFNHEVGNNGIWTSRMGSSSKPNWKFYNETYNKVVNNGQTVSFGWNATPGGLNGQKISNIKLILNENANCD